MPNLNSDALSTLRRAPSSGQTRQKLKRSTMLAAALASGMLVPVLAQAQALPTGGQVVAGSAGIAGNGGSLTISQSSDKAVIDWSSFSIGNGNSVQFNNGTGATLNRVTGGNLSSIDGLLSATGSVYLINPNGVIIGKSGVVKVGGGFTASTLDIGNANFLNGGDLTLEGSSLASVINLGQIGALGGDVALVAANVRNDGTVVAPNGALGLLAGSRVLMRDSAVNDGKFLVLSGGAGTSATNTGSVEAATAELRAQGGNVYALAGNTQGLITATGVSSHDGRIFLSAGTGSVEVAGSTLSATNNGEGGSVALTGQNISVASDATLDASGAHTGGTVTAIADMASGQLDFHGTALAKGSLNGGFIETSGHGVDFTGGRFDTTGARTGNWLVDPDDLTVDSASAATISTALATTDVTLQTTSTTSSGTGVVSTGGSGDITINSDISWSSANTLHLDSYHTLQVNANLTVSGAGGVVLSTNDGGSETGSGGGTGGDYYFAYGKSLSFTNTSGGGQWLKINGNTFSLLYSMADFPSGTTAGKFALAKSIDASSTSYTSANPVGNLSSAGIFTGLGNTISNLTINRPSSGTVGLFGTNSGIVRDIGLVGGSVSGSGSVGSLVGVNNGTVANAWSSASVSGSAASVGGLVGWNNSGTIKNAFTTGSVTNTATATGGLAGRSLSGSITNSFSSAAVTSSSSSVGGLVGLDQTSSITTSLATGPVNGSTSFGGLIGNNSGTITNSYYDSGTTGQSDTGKGTAQTTAQLQSASFSGLGSAWGTGTGLYPYLKTFFPNGVVAVSGTAYNSSNTAVSKAKVTLSSGGSTLDSAYSGANGYYYIVAAKGTTDSTAGVTEVLSGGSSVTGAAFSDTANFTTSNITGLDVTSGTFQFNTSASSYATLKTEASAAFGSSTYTSLLSTLSSAAYKVSASSNFTIDSALDTSSGTVSFKTLSGDLTLGTDLSLSGTTALTLDGYQNLYVNGNIVASGTNAITLNANNVGAGSSGDYSFAIGKSLSFTNTPSAGQSLKINGTAYNLLYSTADLIGIDGQSGYYALANSIDATSGTPYTNYMVQDLISTFTGLGHTVSNLSILGDGSSGAGLFSFNSGAIRDLGVTNAHVDGLNAPNSEVGILVGDNFGTVSHVYVTGVVLGGNSGFFGGLAGYNNATISGSFANVSVQCSGCVFAGGLVGSNDVTISDSYATGPVAGGAGSTAGGLVGQNYGTITHSYATGDVTGDTSGGLVGVNYTTVSNSYYDSGTTGQSDTGKGTAQTTAQLQDASFSSLGSAWGTGTGLYPYLKTFFPNGVQAVSGMAYDYLGDANAGATIAVYKSTGNNIQTVYSGANGYYYAYGLPGTITTSTGVGVTEILGGNSSIDGATFAGPPTFSNGNVVNFNVLGGYVTQATSATTYSAFLAGASSAATTGQSIFGSSLYNSSIAPMSGVGIIASGAFTVDQDSGGNLYVKTGGDLTVSANQTLSGTNALTLDAHDNLYVNANLVANSANAVTFKTGDGGTGDYSFLQGKSLSFTNTSGGGQTLNINGNAYTLLYTFSDLKTQLELHTGYFALAKGLSLSSTFASTPISEVDGTFTGLGNTITGLSINAPNDDYVGFFGTVSGAATVRDIGLNGGTVYGHFYSGPLVGHNVGTVKNAWSSVDTHVAYRSGGLVGQNSGTITNSHATGAVTSNGDNGTGVSDMGGLVGWNDFGIVSQSYATGTVTGTANTTGGLVAYNGGGTIINSFATGGVFGNDYAGGLVGFSDGGTISNAYSTGYVSANQNGGGFIGHIYNTTISNSYWDTTTSGTSNGVGEILNQNGLPTGMTRTDLQNNTLPGGFSTDFWATGTGLYPYLKALFPAGMQSISGTTLNGSGAALPAATMAVYVGGAQVGGTAASGADGYYYLMAQPGTVGSSTSIGITETDHNGSSVTGLAYTDLPTLTSGQVTGFDVRSGRQSYVTTQGNYSLVSIAANNVFGSNYSTFTTALSSADTYIAAINAFSIPGASLSFGGALSVTAVGGITLGGNGTSTTITATGSASFGSAVTLGKDVTVSGSAVTFGSTVNGAHALTVNSSGATTFTGVVGGSTALTSLTTNAGGTVVLNGNVKTTGLQSYGEAMTIGTDVTLASTGSGAITFGDTVNGAHALTVNTAGATTFTGVVGGTTALTSLTTDTGGTTALNYVTTTGLQSYGDAVTLNADSTMTSTGNGNIGFTSTLDGGHNLSIFTSGATSFGGVVGGTTALTSLYTNVGGTTSFNGSVSTYGTQTYNDAVTLNADAIMYSSAGGAIAFSTVNGAHNLSVYTGGATSFSGAVGGTTALTALATDTGGTVSLGGNVTTTGLQSYGEAMTIGTDISLTAGDAITLNGTVNGAHALTVKGTGLTLHGMGDTNALTSLSGKATSGNISVAGVINTTGSIFLAANGTFTNTGGSSALNAGTNFTVYTQNASDPTGTMPVNSFGGLTAGNYYNDAYNFTSNTFASTVPSGNHFVYAYAAKLSVTPDTKSLGYNGNIQSDSYSVLGYLGSDASSDVLTGSVTGLAATSKNATDYTITASGTLASAQNYQIEYKTGVLTISKAALTIAAVTDTKGYDGDATSTGVVGVTGLQGSDTVTGKVQAFDSKDAGSRTLSVTGYTLNDGNTGNNYTVTTQTAAGSISKAALTIDAVTDSKTYDGDATSTGTVSVVGLKGSDTVTGKVQAFDSKNAGTRTLSVTGYTLNDGNNGDNYTVTTHTASGSIAKAALTIAAGTDSKTYDGDATSTGTVSVTGLKGSDTVTGKVQAFDSKNAGSRTLSVTGYTVNDGNTGGNYTVTTQTASGSIAKAALTIAAGTDSKTYDGDATSTGTISVTGLKGSDTVTNKVQAFDSKNAGSRTLSVTGYTLNDGNTGDNYTVTTQTASGSIAKAALTIAAGTDSKTYDGDATSTGTVSVTGLKGSDTVTGKVQAFDSKNAGARTLSVTGYTVNDGNTGGNYTVTTQTASGSIAKAALTIAAGTDSKTYDGDATSTGTVSVTGLKGSDTVTGKTQAFDSKNAGSRTLSVTGYTLNDGNTGGNYTVTTQTASGNIAKAALTIAAGTDSKTYDASTASTGTVSAIGLKGSDTVTGATQAFDSKNAGSRTLSVTGYTVNDGNTGGNYTVTTQTASGNIAKAALTIAAGTDSKTYDGDATSTGTVSVTGLKGSDTVTGKTQAFDSKNAGSRTLSVTGYTLNDGNTGGNYTVTTQTASGNIAKAALTIAAGTDSKTYDATTSSTGTISVTGLKGSDTVTGATQAFDSKNAGSRTLLVNGYTVNDGNTGGNYTVTTQTASGSIAKAALTAGLTGTTTKTYDATLSATLAANNYTLTGVLGSDTITLNNPVVGSYGDINVGSGKTVTVTGLALLGTDAGNYTINSSASANIGTITARKLTLTSIDTGKFVGAADPALTYAIGGEGLVGTDALTGGLARDTGEDPGNYAINQGSLAASSNYDVTFVKGAFSIFPVALQNNPVVNPINTSTDQSSQPVIMPAPIGLNTAGGSASDASGTGTGTTDAGSAAGTGDETAGKDDCDTGTSSAGAGCGNLPYPTNQSISSSITFASK